MHRLLIVSLALGMFACASDTPKPQADAPLLEVPIATPESDEPTPLPAEPEPAAEPEPQSAPEPAPQPTPPEPAPEPTAPEPTAPEPEPDPFPAGQDQCGDIRMAEKVYNGTREPSAVPLTPGQILAVGSFNGCTGTLIAPRWVLSASHCDHRVGAEFCMGPDPDNPVNCVRAARVIENPDADQTLLELEQDASVVMPGVEPVPILTELMDDTWMGRQVEAAGYGQTEYGGFNTRWFTAQPISGLTGTIVTINGMGQRGVCFGDSGGPVFALASDGSVRTAGDLSNGDPSCVGEDNYTRVDVFADWIESHTGPVAIAGAPCGTIGVEGACSGDIAVWCGGDMLVTEPCATRCGWDADAAAFRCLEGEDPCEGLSARGSCQGEQARWCEDGVVKTRDCGVCGEVCSIDGAGATCVPDPCEGIDELGRCNGDVAEWCEGGQLRSRDCGARGRTCGYVNDRRGYSCQR